MGGEGEGSGRKEGEEDLDGEVGRKDCALLHVSYFSFVR